MLFQPRLHRFLSAALLFLCISTVSAPCFAQDPSDNELLTLQEKEASVLEWLKDTHVEISEELKKKQLDTAVLLTLSTRVTTFFVLMEDYRNGRISLPSAVIAFGTMTALTYYSSKHLQRYDMIFSKPIPWRRVLRKLLRIPKKQRRPGELLTAEDLYPKKSASLVEKLLRRSGFSAFYFSLLNAILHSKNEVVNNSHAIWTQEGLMETAHLVLAASLGSSMFHAVRNTFVSDPEKSARIYSFTSILALNLMGLYQLGIHAPIPSGPDGYSMTLMATYGTYIVGSAASILMRDGISKKIKEDEKEQNTLPLSFHDEDGEDTTSCFNHFHKAT